MRAMTMVAGLALALVACGGKSGEQQPADQPATPAPAEQAPAATGTTHEVAMDFDGKVGSFSPAELTIKAGDIVKFVVKSGPPHNVAFDAGTLPAGAADVLGKAMTETMGPLTGPMKVGMGESYEINFAGVPAGTYDYHCTPHVAFGMKAKLIVQ